MWDEIRLSMKFFQLSRIFHEAGYYLKFNTEILSGSFHKIIHENIYQSTIKNIFVRGHDRDDGKFGNWRHRKNDLINKSVDLEACATRSTDHEKTRTRFLKFGEVGTISIFIHNQPLNKNFLGLSIYDFMTLYLFTKALTLNLVVRFVQPTRDRSEENRK